MILNLDKIHWHIFINTSELEDLSQIIEGKLKVNDHILELTAGVESYQHEPGYLEDFCYIESKTFDPKDGNLNKDELAMYELITGEKPSLTPKRFPGVVDEVCKDILEQIN